MSAWAWIGVVFMVLVYLWAYALCVTAAWADELAARARRARRRGA